MFDSSALLAYSSFVMRARLFQIRDARLYARISREICTTFATRYW